MKVIIRDGRLRYETKNRETKNGETKNGDTENNPLNVVILGYGALGGALVKGMMPLQKQGICTIQAVFPWSYRQHPKAAQWKNDPEEKTFLALLKKYRLPLLTEFSGVNSPEFIHYLDQAQPDLLLVGSWGEIFKPPLLHRHQPLFINCHPSLLPRHRGANPYVSAIRCGDPETGVTFHLMDEGVDTGPILLQKRFPLMQTEMGSDLRDKCGRAAEALLPELIQQLVSDSGVLLQPQPTLSPEMESPYTKRLQLPDAVIQWEDSPQSIERHIRALQPWMFGMTFLDNRLPMVIERAELISVDLKNQPVQALDHTVYQPHPGTLVYRKGHHLWFSTQDPHQHLHVSRYRLFWGGMFWPPFISHWMATWVPSRKLYPGQRARNMYSG